MRKAFPSIAMVCAIGSTHAYAVDAPRSFGIQDDLNRCVVKATNQKERLNIAKWVLVLQTKKSAQVAPNLVSQDQLILLEKNAVAILDRISNADCRAEINGANMTVGPTAVSKLLEYLVSTAVQELISDHPVEAMPSDSEKEALNKNRPYKPKPRELDRLVTANIPIDPDVARQQEKWANQAKDGDLDAQYLIGQNCSEGIYFCDANESVRWLRLSADNGNSEAQNNLGVAYYRGREVARDYKQAIRLFRLSAEQGNPKAQFNLAWSYIVANGITQDYSEAAKWYLKSAEQGFAPAQIETGDCYALGQGVEQNWEKAFVWYWRAANQGDVRAKRTVAVMSESAANHNDATGQYQFAMMYETGHCVEENHSIAYAMYSKAISNCADLAERRDTKAASCDRAEAAKERLASQLSKSELEVAEILIEDMKNAKWFMEPIEKLTPIRPASCYVK